MAGTLWGRGLPAAIILAALIAAAVVFLRLAPGSAPEPQVSVAPTAAPADHTPPDLETPTSPPAPTARAYPLDLLRDQSARVFAAVAQGETLDKAILVVTLAHSGSTAGHAIAWREDGRRGSQLLPAGADRGAETGTFEAGDSAVIHAIQQTSDRARELGIVYDATAYGSGSPTARLVLLRLEGDEWRVLWDAGGISDWRGSHGRIQFPRGDLSEVVVRSDSWAEGSDALSSVIHESNAGPHREFIDTWVREGDAYVRTSAETVPSAYATLVEFLYALGTNDQDRAQALVTAAALVDRARSLGLDGALGQHWLTRCPSDLDCTQAGPIGFDPQGSQGEPEAVVFFEEEDGRWLISDLQWEEES